MHRPVMLDEVLRALDPQPGERMADGTLGHGGHASALLPRLLPGGSLLGLDQDPLQIPVAEARLRAQGFPEDTLIVRRSNFAGLPRILAELGWTGLDGILLDLGVSSMQIDNPERGFSYKHQGPLDMRMNPNRGETAAAWLAKSTPEKLEAVLFRNADEPHAERLARALAGQRLETSEALADAIRSVLTETDAAASIPRVFQALRIQINDEFGALESILRDLPICLNPNGRVAVLTFHSGEDRRVKHTFAAGLKDGTYAEFAKEPLRPSAEEIRDNPRASCAKLRWARKS
jgi:16S rRNA (cytosine1402-N4)-methyltransferase